MNSKNLSKNGPTRSDPRPMSHPVAFSPHGLHYGPRGQLYANSVSSLNYRQAALSALKPLVTTPLHEGPEGDGAVTTSWDSCHQWGTGDRSHSACPSPPCLQCGPPSTMPRFAESSSLRARPTRERCTSGKGRHQSSHSAQSPELALQTGTWGDGPPEGWPGLRGQLGGERQLGFDDSPGFIPAGR